MSSLSELANDVGRNKIKKIPKSKNGLIVSFDGSMYCIEGNKRYLIGKREDAIAEFCLHNGILYDCSLDGIFNTLKGKEVPKIDRNVFSICSHGGRFYDGGPMGIYDTFKNNCLVNPSFPVLSLCSHDGSLYYGCDDGSIYNMSEGKKVARRKMRVYTLFSHNGSLYDGGANCEIKNTLENKIVAERKEEVFDICFHEGKLYDCNGAGGIYDTLNDPKGKNPLWGFDKRVDTIASVNMRLWRRLIKKGESAK